MGERWMNDLFAAAFSFAVCQLVMAFFKLTYDVGLIHIHLLRKLIHISLGLIVMLCWPMFSCHLRGRVLAAVVPALCVFKFLITANLDQVINLVQKYPHCRDLVLACLAYALTIAFVTVFYWRTPLAIAAICSLCAGDDIRTTSLGWSTLKQVQTWSWDSSLSLWLLHWLNPIPSPLYLMTISPCLSPPCCSPLFFFDFPFSRYHSTT